MAHHAYIGAIKTKPPRWACQLLSDLGIGYSVFEQPSQIEFTVDGRPLIGLLAESEDDLGVLDAPVFERLAPHYVLSPRSQSREDFLKWLLARALDSTETLARQNGVNCLALAEMRDHLRTTQIAFSELERQLADIPVPLEWVSLELLDGGDDHDVSVPAGAVRTLTQNLPRFGGWPKGFAFRLGACPEDGTDLDVTARGRWSGETYGLWHVDATTGAGWVRLEFSPRLHDVQEPLQILISNRAKDVVQGYAIRLSATPLLPDFHMQVDGVSEVPRPIAVRLYTGLPGLSRPPVGAIVDARDEGLSPTTRFITAEQAKAFEVVAVAFHPDHPVVAHLPDHNGLLVHPTGTSPTVAALRRLPARAGDILYCEVHHLGDASSASVECALAVVPAGRPWNAADPEVEGARGTPWVLTRPQHPAELAVEVPSGESPLLDVYLQSRSPDGNLTFAWSVFCNLRFSRVRDRQDEEPDRR